MADLKDLAEQYGLEDYEQLLGGYPNAEKFLTGLKDAAVRSVPTTEQMRDPNFIIDTAGLGGAIKAYHGTPHLFDRFDMSKLGTGEGAQAYGHGLYFAQDPNIAEIYRKNLTANSATLNDKKFDDIVDELDKSAFDYTRTYGNKEKALDALNSKIKDASKFDDVDWLNIVKHRLENSKFEKPQGNIYETSIRWPNAEREASDPLGEHHLLDWDQPLSEQSDYVRNKLKKSDFYKNANKAYKDQKQWYLDPSQKTGESFLKYMRSGYDDEIASGIKDAEQYLKNLDIPGLKYLDATSRSTDKGTRNYVMFGDEYPEITKRAGSMDELQEKYAEGGIVKAQDQNENLGKLAEMLGSARDVGNQYTVPSWVPLAGGVGAGDLLMGKTPEEIENWSYGNPPMQIPEMSNVPQFKRGRAQSLADALTTLAPSVKATEGLPAGLSFIGPKSRNWDKVAAELAAKKLDEGADPAEVWREHLIGRMPDKTLFSEISDKDASFKGVGSFGDVVMNRLRALQNAGKKTVDDPMNVADIFKHRDLAESYPELFPSTEVQFLPKDTTLKGSMQVMDDGTNILKMPYDAPHNKKSTMLHELQHAIQNQEGWGQGGSPQTHIGLLQAEKMVSPLKKEILDLENKYRENFDDDIGNALRSKRNDLERLNDVLSNPNLKENESYLNNIAYKAYKNLTGEAQARATQDRLDMDMAQRRENYPLAGGKLSDIPLEDLIYKYASDVPSLSADPLSKYKDYVGEHSAPLGDSGAPLHNLTANENAIYPSDVYSSQANQYYGSGEPEDAQLFAMAQRLKDKPNEKVSIYRAVPKMQSNSEKSAQLEKDLANYMKRGRMPSNSDFNNKSDWYEWASNERDRLSSLPEETFDPLSINHGDWVALDKKYAKEHGESALGGDYKILSKKVPARQLFTNGDSIREWGWDSRYAEGGSVDKDSLQLDKPQRTPNHPTKSHIVKTMVDGKEKIIRFGEQGAETAGKPKEGESDRMTAKRESFKARHAKNIAKGKSSAAYWANKVKWAEGGEVDLSDNQQMKAIPQQPNLARLAELLQDAKSSGNQYSVPNWVPLLGGSGAGDMLLGNAPEEIENWSYGDMPMRVPEISNVPQFKKGRAQSLADTAMLLAGPAESTARNAMAGNVGMIIKPKGGNWLDAYGKTPSRAAYKFERSVDPELADYARAGMHLMPHEYNETVPVMAVNDWLQQKLGKYIQNEMGTPEDPVRRIAEEWPVKRDVLISQQQSKIPNLQELAAKYEDMGLPPEVIANRMANAQRETAGIQDKITEIEGYNPLHYTPREVRNLDDIESIKAKRAYEGYPEEGIAKTDLGKLWEHYADENITPIKVKNVSEMNVDKNPWLTKLNDEDKVYITDNMAGTGFDKLADELRKATRPDTDLPDFLRIDPAKLSRVSMPQAVEHVAKINAWREAEKLKEGRNAATVMHKEYPDQGLSWMQMKMPEPTFLEGHYLGEDSRGNPSVLDTSGSVWSSASTPEEALAQYRDAERRDALKAALKFEGDTMGHCVGQYCDEVGRGDTNIYSLRDRRGEPHVTIETKGDSFDPDEFLSLNKDLLADPWWSNRLKQIHSDEYISPQGKIQKLMNEMSYAGETFIQPKPMEKIVQIKGKQNAAPNEKYLPAIQDFVRSQDWSMVHDLPNSGLLRLQKYKSDLNDDLYNQALEKHGTYVTQEELNALQNEFYERNKDIPIKGFAKGGEVKDLHDKYEESDYGYGSRPDKTKKGLGYFGELERPDGTGVMTEYSIGVPINGEEMDVPTLIPTLTPDEIRLILHMQDGEDMPRSIVHKAIDHAHQRLSEGKPIFATEEDLYAHGGIVDVLHNDAIEQIMKAFMDSMEDEPKEDEPAAVSIQITTQSQPLKSGKIPTSIREAKHG
jgi:hypothetical protein